MSDFPPVDVEFVTRMEKLREDFLETWRNAGEPHPSSNAYIALTVGFYYTKGVEYGMEYAIKMEGDSSE